MVGVEEMVVAHFEQVRGGSIGRQVPAKFRVRAIGAHHHGERVPAHQRAEPCLNLKIAGELGLIGKRDGVAIRRTEKGRQRNAPRTGMIEQPAQKEMCALRAFCLQYRIERLQPFPGFDGIGVLGQYAPIPGKNQLGVVGKISHATLRNSRLRRVSSCSSLILTAQDC